MSAPDRSLEELVARVVDSADKLVASCSRMAQDPNLDTLAKVDAVSFAFGFWKYQLYDRLLEESE